MADNNRGADLIARALVTGGTSRIFSLSGNQIMPVYDACFDTDIEIIHVRHEAGAVQMADVWGRLTDQPGVALVTAGPGLANTVSAVYMATMSESPMVLLSGHAPTGRLGHGAFQEMAQADIVGHVAKASWTANEASQLGHDIARAFRIAASGRPGPVHIALPVDLVNATVEEPDRYAPDADSFQVSTNPLDEDAVKQIIDALAEASRPLILAGPAAMRGSSRQSISQLSESIKVPVAFMESPRGTNDPSLGAFAEVLPEADLLVLLGKKLDYTIAFGEPPGVNPDCRIVQIDPDQGILEQTRAVVGATSRLRAMALADARPAAEQLMQTARRREQSESGWYEEVQAAISYRPAEWKEIESSPDAGLHAVEAGTAVQRFLDEDDQAIFVSDGGEFGQWAQACVSAPRRIINGVGGAIGGSIPHAVAARAAAPNARIVAMLGDGSFGFQAMEFDTAVRHKLPFVAVVGNDAAWNAERQIQLRSYGPDRVFGCDLLPTRYDEMVRALGGYGEQVTEAVEVLPALERAHASGLPACVNVIVDRVAAPNVRRG